MPDETELELADIQSGVLRPRPTPYVATFFLFRIDDRQGGREMMRRLANVIPSAANPDSPTGDSWVSVSLTYSGLKALGVPQESLDSFSWEFRQGMTVRAKALGDTGESSPENWEQPFGTADIHVVLTVIAPDTELLEAALGRARTTYQELKGVTAIWRQDCFAPEHEKEHFGFRDGISHPAIEGSGIPGSNPHEEPLKAGEFVLGYPDEMRSIQKTEPEILGRNGTYVVFRKLHQRVAAFRRCLKENAKNAEQEELLAAKMMGRWRSGAPLALCPFHDDPELGADKTRNNTFQYHEDDELGLKTPIGSHCRRTNPRDAKVAGVVRLHRMLRRGTAYGPELPKGVLEDDGQDRGLMFAFVGAHIGRQFEFAQSEWINGGEFLGLGDAKDPVTGNQNGGGHYSFPQRPIPKRMKNLSSFVVTRGGEYAFMPGLRALRWLSNLQT